MRDRLAEELSELQIGIERIPSPDPPPRTTLQIQGLADQEDAWQNYLQYFLDPQAGHGLGADALTEFLRQLDDLTSDSLPTHPSEDVVVEAEVESDSGNRPDIIIRDPERFFVCCELKLYSLEGDDQTRRYIDDAQIGTVEKDSFPDRGHHYVYLKRPGHPTADADEFVTITWRQIRNWFMPLLFDNRGRYPTRTTAQLGDFLETIQQDMTDDEHIQTAREKMQLYFDHEDAIREAKQGLETVYEYEKENWRRRFVDEYLPETWSDEWHTNPSTYGHIYHSKWRQNDALAIEDARVRLHFVHLIRDATSFEDGKLTIQLRWPGENPYRERFKEHFVSDQFAEQLDPLLGQHDIDKRADYSYNNPRFTEKIYPVAKSDLPESYYETLQQAVQEHQALAPVINEVLGTAITDVETDLEM